MGNLFTQNIKSRLEKLPEEKSNIIKHELPTTMAMLRNATAVIMHDKTLDKYLLVTSRESDLPEELENWTVVNRKLQFSDLTELENTRDVVLFLGAGISQKMKDTLNMLH